jgi:hypothetical protein
MLIPIDSTFAAFFRKYVLNLKTSTNKIISSRFTIAALNPATKNLLILFVSCGVIKLTL